MRNDSTQRMEIIKMKRQQREPTTDANGIFSSINILDLSQAYDYIYHYILMQKLYNYAICEN